MKRLNRYSIPTEVKDFATTYLKEHLPKYELANIVRKSEHPDDDYLYMVAAKKSDGTFTVWTCLNMSTKSMNHGYYGLETYEDCEKVFEENYFNY